MRLFILIALISWSLQLSTLVHARSQFTLPASQYALTIKTTPRHATIKIMNIKPSYQEGIQLKEGNYRIEVSAKGYETVKQNVIISKKDKIVYIALDKKTSLIGKPPPTVDIHEEQVTVENSIQIIPSNKAPQIIKHSTKRRFTHSKGYNRFLRYANRLYGVSYEDPQFIRFCKRYANLAVRQAQRRIDNHCEQEISVFHNDKANQWLLRKRPQEKWCRTVSSHATYNETIYREERLEYCISGTILRSK